MYKKHHHSNQHGMATMAITLILLFIGTLVALYTAKTSIKEQQISANQYRADQSLSTANAAMDWGVAYLSEAGGFLCDDGLVGVLENYFTDLTECPVAAEYDKAIMCTIRDADQTRCTLTYNKSSPLEIGPGRTENALSIGSSEMYYAYVDNGEGCDDDGDGLCDYIPVKGGIGERRINDVAGGGDGNTLLYFANIKIYGIGHSDDDTGKRTVSVDINASSIFGDPGLGASAFPLTTKSTVDPNGNITIINRYDNKTIWAGDEIDPSGSTDTYVLKDGMGWNCNDIAKHDECVRDLDNEGKETVMSSTSKASGLNADIIDTDSNLANLEADEFFINFFGKTKKQMKMFAKESGLYVEAVDNKNLEYKNESGKKVGITWAGLADYTPLVWIDAPDGYDPSGDSTLGQVGTEEDPMVLIVDGNLSVKGYGGLVLVGALYVTGTWEAGSNPVVQGMLIVESEAELQGGGSYTLIYDADLFNGKIGPPPGTIAGTAPGTWKDWE